VSALRNSPTASAAGDADRLLAWAIVASILAHALILLVMQGWLDPKRMKAPASPPLVAHLAQAAPPPQVAPPPVPPQAIEPRPKAAPIERPRKSVPAEPVRPKRALPPSPAASQMPAVVPAPPVVESPKVAEPLQPPAAAPSAAVRTEAAPVPAAPASSASPPASDSMDPATLGQYRIAIIAAAKRYKRYPRLALDNNWEGQADVRLMVGPDGNTVSLSIRSRSGYEVLDQQALEMIRKAKPLTPIPPALRGKSFTVDVPVVFSLKEETG
jgi:protein TonB